MTIDEVRARLRERAESYSRDARALDEEGDTYAAVAYRTIADELRKAADEAETE